MKNVIITGGGSGIGEAIAKIFCKNGCNVYILGRRKEKLEKVCEGSDNSINYFVCDINKEDDIKQILSKLDKVDTLINCAGIISSGEESENYDYLELSDIININLKGTLSI